MTQSSSQMTAVEAALDAMLRSDSASEFCRSLVHADFTGTDSQGCQLYLLDNNSTLKLMANYGLTIPDEGREDAKELSAWDVSPISECVRMKSLIFDKNKSAGKAVICIPLLKDEVPLGVLCMVMGSSAKPMPFGVDLVPILSKMGAYIVSTLASSKIRSGAIDATANGEDLTSRQIQILELMAEGLVNVEIAGQLLLSESTIRQETVRIYRALGVPNRTEASKKAKSLGLIGRRSHIQIVG